MDGAAGHATLTILFTDVEGSTAFRTRAGDAAGHLDHLALAAPNQEAFRALRRRAMGAGATDGHVRDFGAAWVLKFRDPDGMEGDLVWADRDASLAALRRYGDAPILPWS